MTAVVPFRPLGDTELRGLTRRLSEAANAWVSDWTATASCAVLSAVPCAVPSLTRMVASLDLVLSDERSAVLWWTRGNCTELGRACVLEGDQQKGDTRLDKVFGELGRSALSDLLGAWLAQPTAPALREIDPLDLRPGVLGADGVLVDLSVGGLKVSVFLARGALLTWLTSAPQPTARLRPVQLPARLTQTRYQVVARSRAFEISLGDVVTLSPGDVLNLGQRLDTPFEFCVFDHADIVLKAYPGRSGDYVAVEVFEN